jgi:Tol biopolymer transport system component
VSNGIEQIAFASTLSGIPQVYLVNMDATGLTQITNMENGACQPTWSPDGSKLVFTSPCRSRGEFFEVTYKDSSLYLVNADGTGLKPLTTVPGSDFDPAWSPDGKRIAFTSMRDGNKQIYLLDADSLAVTRLTDKDSGTENSQPSWSPSGDRLAYLSKRVGAYQVWAMTDTGQENTQLVRSGQQLSDYSPVWSHDGETVLFNQRYVGVPTFPWLMSIEYEDHETRNPVKLELPRPIEDVEFSSNGSWLVFEGMDKDGNRDIYFSTIIGGNRTRLTIDPGIDFDPAWRPVQNQ